MDSNSKRNLVLELHKSARKFYPRRRTIVKGISDLYQADLVEMIPYSNENDGYKYILTCINCFSKMAYCLPLKSKTSKEVANKFEQEILLKLPKYLLPKHIQTDMGKEFYGTPFRNLMHKYNIIHYSTYSSIKAAIIERFNRTLKNKMWIDLSIQGAYRWVDILSKLVSNYNQTKHRSIGLRPIDVNKKNEHSIALRLNKNKQILTRKPKFKIGQLVRISRLKHVFEKGYKVNWSYEVFKVVKYSSTFPRVYHLQDLHGNKIKGCFYEQELLEAKNPDVYLVEKVLKRKSNKVFVKYLGFGDEENQWLPISQVQ
jgi:Integrase core domain.